MYIFTYSLSPPPFLFVSYAIKNLTGGNALFTVEIVRFSKMEGRKKLGHDYIYRVTRCESEAAAPKGRCPVGHRGQSLLWSCVSATKKKEIIAVWKLRIFCKLKGPTIFFLHRRTFSLQVLLATLSTIIT